MPIIEYPVKTITMEPELSMGSGNIEAQVDLDNGTFPDHRNFAVTSSALLERIHKDLTGNRELQVPVEIQKRRSDFLETLIAKGPISALKVLDFLPAIRAENILPGNLKTLFASICDQVRQLVNGLTNVIQTTEVKLPAHLLPKYDNDLLKNVIGLRVSPDDR